MLVTFQESRYIWNKIILSSFINFHELEKCQCLICEDNLWKFKWFFELQNFENFEFPHFCCLSFSVSNKRTAHERTTSVIVNISEDHFPANIYLFKVNDRDTRNRYEIQLKFTTKNNRATTIKSSWCFYFWLWTYFTPSVFIVDFE